MNKKLNDALNEVSDKYLSEVENYKRPNRRPYWVAAMAAVLALVIGLSAAGGLFTPQPTNPVLQGTTPQPTNPVLQGTTPKDPIVTGIENPGSLNLTNLVAAPVYPQMAPRPNGTDNYEEDFALYNAWWQSCRNQYNQPDGYADSLTNFFRQSIPAFLNTEKNCAYSPVNVYIALAMLAETAGGNSRQQILDLLELDSIEALREQVHHVWNAHYCDDGVTTLLLANSLWIDSSFPFRQDTLSQLAENYYASSFWGDLGTEEIDQQLQTWLNANTGGLLQEQVKNVKLDPTAVFALASTVYFAADWGSEFSPQKNEDMLFHCDGYDLMTCFMKKSFVGQYYRGENFGAVSLALNGDNRMWLILPDEGHTVEEILQSDEYLRLTLNPSNWEKKKEYLVHLSLPKFDVTGEINLIPGLQNMGITDAFDPTLSDFTPLADDGKLVVSSASHAARVVIDEEGCLAAAFTVIDYKDSGGLPGQIVSFPEMDFILDRPFFFVVSSRDNLPLFVGTVVQP